MPCDYQLLPHPGIQTLAPYIPGKSAEALAHEKGLSDIIKLASNENPLGCSPLVTEALSTLSGIQLATYCTSQSHPLREKIAQKLHLDPDNVFLANGSDTLFTLLFTCFALHQEKHLLTHDHAFITFSVQANTLGIPYISTPLNSDWQVDIDAMIKACTEKTALIFIANPNNPTGVGIPKEELKRLLHHIPESTLLVVDEAYYDYATEASLIDELLLYPNLVITRTFSKAYGLAGLRLGFAVGNPAVISLLHRIQLPFVVNIATLTAGSSALDDTAFVQHSVQSNAAGLKQMAAGLTKLRLPFIPSCANFITFDCKQDALPVYLALQEQGIILRPLHPYGLNNYLRVSIGTDQQNQRFLDTLPFCISTHKE